jgi:uncharacterized protein DUF6448
MISRIKLVKLPLAAALSAVLMFAATPASAHCDGLDGPVIGAARQALDTGDVNRVLIWVKPGDEPVIRDAFGKAREVRSLNATAKELADQSFFETLVRVHRAGEGEPYTGLKPAGRDLGPAVPVGDKAVESGSVRPVIELLTENVHHGVEERYKRVMALKNYKPDDVAAGQKYVQAYVEYIHAVEKIHSAAAAEASATHHAH